MSNPDFWRDLAIEFRALSEHRDSLAAHWTRTVGSGTPTRWRLTARDPSVRYRFEPLARRGAQGFGFLLVNSDLLTFWLDALKEWMEHEDAPASRVEGYQNKGGVQIHEESGVLREVCYASADFCSSLESQALERQKLEVADPADFRPPEPVSASEKSFEIAGPLTEKIQAFPFKPSEQKESTGQQIDRLRKECRWTIEELAEKVGINIRTVQRHIADKSSPYSRHLSGYERAFSKALNIKVVISNLP